MARRPATPAILKGAILIAVWTPHCRSGRPSVLSRSARGCGVVTLASSCLLKDSLGASRRRLARHDYHRSNSSTLFVTHHLRLLHRPQLSLPAYAPAYRSAIAAFLYFQNSSSALVVPIIRSLMIFLCSDLNKNVI